MKPFLVALVAFAGVFSTNALATEKPDSPVEVAGATTVDTDAAVELITESDDLVIIDARKAQDYNTGHIEDAVLLTNTSINSQADIAVHVPTKDTPVLVYCNGIKCGRSSDAAGKAVSFGYSNVYYYRNGMAEWTERGLPIETE